MALDPPPSREGAAGEKGGGGGLSTSTGGAPSPSLVSNTGIGRGTPTNQPTSTPSVSTTTSTQVGGGRAKGQSRKCEKRSFFQIITDSQENRNVLEICIQRPDPNTNTTDRNTNDAAQAASLGYDNFADFVFDELKIHPEDCLSFNYSLSNFTNKEVGFKPSIVITPYLGTFTFRGHSIITRRQMSRCVRVTFRDVPISVPDEELLNIVECYGKATDSVVHFQPSSNPKAKGLVNMNTRYIEMEMGEKVMPN